MTRIYLHLSKRDVFKEGICRKHTCCKVKGGALPASSVSGIHILRCNQQSHLVSRLDQIESY